MKKNVFLNALFALDLWVALTIITTVILNIIVGEDRGLMITFASVVACVNAIFCSLIVVKVNSKFFSKRKESKTMIKN